MKIAIIDTLGLCYDGSTLLKRGLGGSESAVVLMSRELSKLGIEVTVFNDCESDDAKPGIYDGVEYSPLKDVEKFHHFDVMIASRSVAPFAPTEIRQHFKSFIGLPDFTKIQENSGYKILWMHDTFCDGDNLIEQYVNEGRINEIFTLSDWHTAYVTNCDHGVRRNFDILKHHIFQTRNGIGAAPKEWVDVRNKDPNLFVFNASVTKGLIPLVEKIWPKVKESIPQAKLKVIGGYYRFREGSEPDQQEKTWRDLVKNHPEIDFTGIITQNEISDILRASSYMIYPSAFPETFGISTLEALAHNVPLITCRFGALEETALDLASWKMQYPVEKNWSLPWLDENFQVDRFVELVVHAYQNKYLHQQKMYFCNSVKDICTWDTVALQWKQHLFKKTGKFLPVDEYKAVCHINDRVREVFGRRFFNLEENRPRKNKEKFINVVTTCFNAENFISKCIESVAQQDYSNYIMTIVDDASTDDTFNVVNKTIDSLPSNIRDKFSAVRNKKNIGAVANQFFYFCSDDKAINMIVDGDDWLVNDPTIFDRYNNLYHEGAEFTYGSCWSIVDNIPLIAQEYPPEIKRNRTYRDYKFNWNMPYTHLRTFSGKLVENLKAEDLQDQDGNWYRAGGDTAIFYKLLESADPDKVVCMTDIVYNYNDAHPLNDYKVNGEEQTRTANKVIDTKKELFTVVMPTMWRCPEITIVQLKRLKDHPLVGEVLIIDNDRHRTPLENLLKLDSRKIIVRTQEKNIGVNPAWNLGIKEAKYDRICFANDDILFDTKIFESLQGKLFPGSGPYGLLKGDPNLGQPESTDYSINFKKYSQGDCIHCFGQLFFFHRIDWIDIPSELVINFGDDFIFHSQRFEKFNPVNLIYNMEHYSPASQTVKDPTVELVTKERFESEKKFYEEYEDRINNLVAIKNISTVVIDPPKKKVLIAIPTARYIESETFKCIFDLEIPGDCEVDFQYFYGYRVDQVRNLIADWAIKGYTHLFSVDHDVTFPRDTLKKLLNHDVDLVCGIYRQRMEPEAIEVYRLDGSRSSYAELRSQGDLVQIGGCGFGCVLVKSEVFTKVGYPQFEYHVALDHANTFSEDNDFCRKANQNGFRLYCDTTITCGHIGSVTFNVDTSFNPIEERLKQLSSMDLLPIDHKNYLHTLSKNHSVIYDIGSSVLHWSKYARKNVWPNAQYILFEAMEEVGNLYVDEEFDRWCIGYALSDKSGEKVKFYQNLEHPGGNSIYRENQEFNPNVDQMFPESQAVIKETITIDDAVELFGYKLPTLIKMDVQGSELNVLKGAQKTLKGVTDIILEMQHENYNVGAPNVEEVTKYLEEIGFKLVSNFTRTNVDGDYHFVRIPHHQD